MVNLNNRSPFRLAAYRERFTFPPRQPRLPPNLCDTPTPGVTLQPLPVILCTTVSRGTHRLPASSTVGTGREMPQGMSLGIPLGTTGYLSTSRVRLEHAPEYRRGMSEARLGTPGYV